MFEFEKQSELRFKFDWPLGNHSGYVLRTSAAERQHNNWRDNGPARPS